MIIHAMCDGEFAAVGCMLATLARCDANMMPSRLDCRENLNPGTVETCLVRSVIPLESETSELRSKSGLELKMIPVKRLWIAGR